MKSPAIIKFLFLIILITTLSCSRQNKKPILLGAIYNLHDSQASLDTSSAHGVELAVADLNARGGINGRPIQLILKDGYSNPDSIKAAAKNLIEQKVVTIIGFSDTDMVLAAGPAISVAGIPFITSGATAPSLIKSIPRVLFLSCFGDNAQAAAGAEFARHKLKKDRVFIISDQNMEYTTYLARYFKESFLGLGGSVVNELTYGETLNSPLPILNALKQQINDYDLIYLASGPDDVGNWINKIRRAGIKQPILGGDAYDSPLLLFSSDSYADQIYFTTHAWMSRNGSSVGMSDFFSKYRKAYGVDPENSFAALGYDAVMLFADAALRAKKIQPSYLLTAIETTAVFKGLTGRVKFLGGSHIPSKEVMIIAVKNNQISLDAVITPNRIPKP